MESPDQKPEGWSDIAATYEQLFEPLTSRRGWTTCLPPSPNSSRACLDLLSGGSADGSPVLSAEAFIGIGRE